jgi:Ca-activated chloride channel homolog
VTALYEIVPVGETVDGPNVDSLKYQRDARETRAAASGELMMVNVRYKAPDSETSRLLTHVQMNRPSVMTANLGFASAVAEFGMLLRESPARGDASFESVASRARTFHGQDREGYRDEFARLVARASGLRRDEPRRQSRR